MRKNWAQEDLRWTPRIMSVTKLTFLYKDTLSDVVHTSIFVKSHKYIPEGIKVKKNH